MAPPDANDLGTTSMGVATAATFASGFGSGGQVDPLPLQLLGQKTLEIHAGKLAGAVFGTDDVIDVEGVLDMGPVGATDKLRVTRDDGATENIVLTTAGGAPLIIGQAGQTISFAGTVSQESATTTTAEVSFQPWSGVSTKTLDVSLVDLVTDPASSDLRLTTSAGGLELTSATGDLVLGTAGSGSLTAPRGGTLGTLGDSNTVFTFAGGSLQISRRIASADALDPFNDSATGQEVDVTYSISIGNNEGLVIRKTGGTGTDGSELSGNEEVMQLAPEHTVAIYLGGLPVLQIGLSFDDSTFANSGISADVPLALNQPTDNQYAIEQVYTGLGSVYLPRFNVPVGTLPNGITFSFWVYFTTVTGGPHTLFRHYNTTNFFHGHCYVTNGNLIWPQYASSAVSTIAPTANQWMHFVVYYDLVGRTSGYYINNQFTTRPDLSIRPSYTSGEGVQNWDGLFVPGGDNMGWQFGVNGSGGGNIQRLPGYIDDMRVYNAVLTSQQVNDLYTAAPVLYHSYDFTSSGGYGTVQSSDTALNNPYQANRFAVAMWVRGTPAADSYFFTITDGSGSGYLDVRWSNQVRLRFFGGTDHGFGATEFTKPSSQEWHHITVAVDMTTSTDNLRIYSDGALVSSGAKSQDVSSAAANSTPRKWQFARNALTSHKGVSAMDQIAIWIENPGDPTISPDALASAAYGGGAGADLNTVAPGSLVAWWKLGAADNGNSIAASSTGTHTMDLSSTSAWLPGAAVAV